MNRNGTIQALRAMAWAAGLLVLAAVGWAAPHVSDNDVPVEPDVALEVLVKGLEHPWSMAWLPDGNLLVTERPGRLRLVVMSADGTAKLHPTPIAGVPELFARGQGGLLDVSLDPAFVTNGRVYLSHAHGNILTNRTRVARAVYRDNRISDWRVIFETGVAKPGSQHFGSRLCWLPDGSLLVSLGEGGNPPVWLDGGFIREQAQNPANQLGKIVRLRDDGAVPMDNPFKGKPGASPDVFSLGHRNVQGLAYDPVRGAVWATEHGALGGDELNRIVSGGNYGWPRVTYSREYFDGSRISPEVSRPGMVDPALVWLTAIAPSGLAVYAGDKFPAWRGDLFAGALVKQSVRHILLDASGQVTGQREVRVGERVRDVRQGPDGYLYLLTDEDDGKLIRIRPQPQGVTPP